VICDTDDYDNDDEIMNIKRDNTRGPGSHKDVQKTSSAWSL